MFFGYVAVRVVVPNQGLACLASQMWHVSLAVSRQQRSPAKVATRAGATYFDHQLMRRAMLEILSIWIPGSYDRNMYHHVPLVYDTVELGERVRRARQARGFRQDELANRIGVTRMTISRLERGESVSVDIALRALSECGIALALVPKFSRVTVINGT